MTDRSGGTIDAESVFGSLMEPVFAIDADGRIAFANERFLTVSGATREEVIGADVDRFERIVEGGFADFRGAVEAVASGASEEERVELEMRHPEDAPVPRRLPAEPRITPIRVDGRDVGVLVSLRNISERKDNERQLERQNERLEEFASTVSHDLRNPLNVAVGRIHLAKEECDADDLDAAIAALDRMAAIIDGTLALARQGQRVGEIQPVSLSDVVDQCWRAVETGRGELRVECDVVIDADAGRLRNLFENLFRNALEHGGEGVTVRVGSTDGAGFFVEDDGPGIPERERENAFEFGYSTAGGNGFGLAIVRWIAEAHGWEVSVEGGAEEGARFEFSGVEIE